MNNIKIVWITPDCFLDVDMPIIPLLANSYQIHWVIEFNCWGNRYKESDFIFCKDIANISLEFIYYHRRRNPLNIIEQLRIPIIVNREKPDLVYSNMSINMYRKILAVIFLNYKRSIFTAHQGKPHRGMKHHKKLNFIRKNTYGHVHFINMFSKSQAKLMSECFPKPKIFQFALPLKNFGKPTNIRPSNKIIRFGSFGRLVHVKRIDLLIEAACNIYERGYRNIKILIAGCCDDWEFYKSRIKYPEIFETQIRMIDNNEIPNIFNGIHYFVQPYNVVSQSGPMKIAFRYNIPLITSNLPGFVDEMVDGVTGFIFETENLNALESTMIKAIEAIYSGEYDEMRSRMKLYIDDNYSEETVIRQYSNMFNEVINSNEDVIETD